ncbi:hypothetical protein MBLNU457_6284t1 [Dothideomycetes sp. NU457]
MASPFKRRKLSTTEYRTSQSQTSTSEAAPRLSISDQPLGIFSHGLQKISAFAQGSRTPPKIEEVHVKVKQHRARNALASEHAITHRHGQRRQAVGLTGEASVDFQSTAAVSVLISVGVDGTSLLTSTSSTTLTSGSGTVTSILSSDSTVSGSGTPSSTVTPTVSDTSSGFVTSSTSSSSQSSSGAIIFLGSTSSASQTSQTSIIGTANSTSSSAPNSSPTSSGVLSSAPASISTNGTSSITSTTTSLSPDGIIGISKLSASARTTSLSSSIASSFSRNGTFTTSSTNLLPALVSSASSRNSSSSTTAIAGGGVLITSGSSVFTITPSAYDDASFTQTSLPASVSEAHSTDLFFFFLTTQADGRVFSIPESRTYSVSTLPGGSVSTSYGPFAPVTATTSSDELSATDGSTITSGASASTSPSSGPDASPTPGIAQGGPGTVTSVVYNTAAGGASATAGSPSSTSTPAMASITQDSTSPPASVLAGGIVGGVAGLAALLLVALVFVRWYRRRGASSMERLGAGGAGGADAGGDNPAFVSRSGPGMAERAGLLPLAGMFRNRHAPAAAPAGERGFERVGGRKLPSAFSGGMSGPEGPSRRPIPMPAVFESGNPSSHGLGNTSNTSFFRDSHGMPGESGEEDPFGDPRMSETLHPGPARQAAVHPGGPYYMTPTGSPPPPDQSTNLLQGRSATPMNAPMSPTYPQAGSRFTEEV